MRSQNIYAIEQDVEINLAGSATLDAACGLAWPWPDDGGKTARKSVKEIRGIRPIDVITDLRLTLLRNGYEPIPIVGKKPIFDNWQAVEITEATIRQWAVEHPDWLNTGLRTKFMSVLDADVDDPKVARSIRIFMEGWCRPIGRMLIRTGRAPRFAVPFRCDVPFTKIVRKLTDTNKLEILATGQQVVAEGIHPDTGKPYAWGDDAAPWNVRRDALPPLDAKTVGALLDELVEHIKREHPKFITEQQSKTQGGAHTHTPPRKAGDNVINLFPVIGDPSPTLPHLTSPGNSISQDFEDYTWPPTVEELAAAVSVIPNDNVDWTSYNNVGMAIWVASNAERFDLFDGYARKASGKYNQKEPTEKLWKGYKTPDRIGFDYLAGLAYEADPGWRD